MTRSKASSAVHDDRSGVPRVDILAHTGLSASRGAGSPSEPLSGSPPMSGPCARMSESTMRQLLSEAVPLDAIAPLEELPRLILGTTDRNLGEMQLRASNTNPMPNL